MVSVTPAGVMAQLIKLLGSALALLAALCDVGLRRRGEVTCAGDQSISPTESPMVHSTVDRTEGSTARKMGEKA